MLSQEGPAAPPAPPEPAAEGEGAAPGEGFGLARLSAMFTSRYRQVPTQCCDVEMTDVRSASLHNSPTRDRGPLDPCRSPTYCDLNATDFYFADRDMATPVEFFRRRTLRNNVERVLDLDDRQRPLTLHLGRFQLSIPRFGRRPSTERRPDTPNVAEINIDDLDFVRLNSNETYTLNGRTIRLLGANFENYPAVPDDVVNPPPYTEAVRYKLYGPPPEYLSRDRLDGQRGAAASAVDEEARTNVEMPPRYEELAAGGDANANPTANSNANLPANANPTTAETAPTVGDGLANNNEILETIDSVINNLPAIDSDVNANEVDTTVPGDLASGAVAATVASNRANANVVQ